MQAVKEITRITIVIAAILAVVVVVIVLADQISGAVGEHSGAIDHLKDLLP